MDIANLIKAKTARVAHPKQSADGEYSRRIPLEVKSSIRMKAKEHGYNRAQFLLLVGLGYLKPTTKFPPRPLSAAEKMLPAGKRTRSIGMTIDSNQWGILCERADAFKIFHPIDLCVEAALGRIQVPETRWMNADELTPQEHRDFVIAHLQTRIACWLMMQSAPNNLPGRRLHGREQSWGEVLRQMKGI